MSIFSGWEMDSERYRHSSRITQLMGRRPETNSYPETSQTQTCVSKAGSVPNTGGVREQGPGALGKSRLGVQGQDEAQFSKPSHSFPVAAVTNDPKNNHLTPCQGSSKGRLEAGSWESCSPG